MKKWQTITTDADLALMSRVLGIKEATAMVMANRGIRSKNTAIAYLRPNLVNRSMEMKDAKKAFERISQGIQKKEKIMIYGDYDADGVMSTVILYKALKMCGADVHFYIPNREEEGYGLNIEAVRAIRETEHDLIITCDNGISALEEVTEANKLGMDVIIIDHHEPGDVSPTALAIIDPKQADCPYPFKEMCAAGLAFMLMEAFCGYTGQNFKAIREELLALAAIATVCDIVDLMADNRSMVKEGLKALNANKRLNPGLGQLIALRGYMDKPIDTFTIGFIIGPCINATGRLESAEMSVRLLLTEDTAEQKSLAQSLYELNEERKAITRKCAERALEKLSEIEDNILVLVDEQCHESIAGIVAGRIKEATNRPAIVLTSSSEAGILKGSGRSIEAYNMFEALCDNRDLFLRFGGHAMAAGLSLPQENADKLKKRLNESNTLTADDLQAIVHIDGELPTEEINLILADELSLLAPFGKGNREPLFVTKNLQVEALRMIPEKSTLIFTFYNRIKGIAFGLNDLFLQELQENYSEVNYRRVVSGDASGLVMDVAHTVESNTFNGRTSVQIRIRDFRIKAK